MTMAMLRAMRRLNARSFTSAAPLPTSSSTGATAASTATAGTTAAASTKANAGAIVRKKKKKQSKDQRFATVGLPLLLFVAGGYMALTQVRFAFVDSIALSIVPVWLCVSCLLLSNESYVSECGFGAVCRRQVRGARPHHQEPHDARVRSGGRAQGTRD